MTNANTSQDWIIVDMGKFVLHVFTQEVREYYDLEGLWTFVIDPMTLRRRDQDQKAAMLLKATEKRDTDDY